MTEKKSPSTGDTSPDVWGIHDEATGAIQYICACPKTREAALIDVLQDFDTAAVRRSWDNMEKVLAIVEREGLTVKWILDTHPHADHLLASYKLREKTGAPNAIGEKVREVADVWKDYYGFRVDPDPAFDHLLADGDTLALGDLELKVMFTPGHTLASITYCCGDAAFVHDTLMQPDKGTARADFPGASLTELWDSIQKILELPGETRLFTGHDYPGEDRDAPEWEATVARQKAENIHLGEHTREDFLRIRANKDETLGIPDQMLAALQFNLRAGRPPEPDADGNRRIVLPLDRF